MSSTIKAKQHENYGTFSILGFLFPFIGIIIGIVYITKDDKLDRKLGEHMIAFSILGWIVWGISYMVWINIQYANQIEQIIL